MPGGGEEMEVAGFRLEGRGGLPEEVTRGGDAFSCHIFAHQSGSGPGKRGPNS